MAERRLTNADRRERVLDAAAVAFAARPYDAVRMDEIAAAAGISRALLYRHFPTKRDLFAAVYERAAHQLLQDTDLRPTRPLDEQLREGLDVHIDYFAANRETVLAANKTLAGEPVIQAIIDGELAVLRDRLVAVAPVTSANRAALTSVVSAWLVFVRVLSVDWLAHPVITRDELREACVGALLGAVGPLLAP